MSSTSRLVERGREARERARCPRRGQRSQQVPADERMPSIASHDSKSGVRVGVAERAESLRDGEACAGNGVRKSRGERAARLGRAVAGQALASLVRTIPRPASRIECAPSAFAPAWCRRVPGDRPLDAPREVIALELAS